MENTGLTLAWLALLLVGLWGPHLAGEAAMRYRYYRKSHGLA